MNKTLIISEYMTGHNALNSPQETPLDEMGTRENQATLQDAGEDCCYREDETKFRDINTKVLSSARHCRIVDQMDAKPRLGSTALLLATLITIK